MHGRNLILYQSWILWDRLGSWHTWKAIFYLLETKCENIGGFKLREPQDQIFTLERLLWITVNGEHLEMGRLEVKLGSKAIVGSQARGDDGLEELEPVGMKRGGR